MKCLFLAAGYATRLYPITENFPKPLLEVKGKPILDWFIDDLDSGSYIDEYIVVTNHKFFPMFDLWAKKHKQKITVMDDMTSSNETRLGAVKDIYLVISSLNINEDLLILAGDNILDFSLNGFIKYALDKSTSCIMRYEENDINRIRRTGNLLIDEDELVLEMLEKPVTPISNWGCPPFYFYKQSDLYLIKDEIDSGVSLDAPGSLAKYISKKSKVHAYLMPGKRYDIGTVEDYNRIK